MALAVAASAAAVIIDSGDGTGNTTAPIPDPGWSNVGIRDNGPMALALTGVYLGGSFVLTAAHVSAGTIWFDGVPYQYVPGTAVQLDNGELPPNTTYADLLMFQIYPEPPLPALAIASLPPLVTTPVIMVGNGLNRGPAFSDPPLPDGYYWGGGQSMRWGTNAVSGTLPAEAVGTWAFETSFDQAGSDHEAQAAVGDSGGPVFVLNGSQWELAGILFGIASTYPSQPDATALYGNLTLTADLSFYRDQIDEVMMPEPSGGLWPGAAIVALLARRRGARRQSAARSSTRR
jgi:hypothetical protein